MENKIGKEFATALIRARMAMKAPGKDAKNPHFKSEYMSLDNLTAAVMEAMEPNGLMVMQHAFTVDGDGVLNVGVETIILHESGEFLTNGRDFFCRVVGGDAQKVGAAVTYLRRYGLGAMMGVVVEEDDDGNKASEDSRKLRLAEEERRNKAASAREQRAASTSNRPAATQPSPQPVGGSSGKGSEPGATSGKKVTVWDRFWPRVRELDVDRNVANRLRDQRQDGTIATDEDLMQALEDEGNR